MVFLSGNNKVILLACGFFFFFFHGCWETVCLSYLPITFFFSDLLFICFQPILMDDLTKTWDRLTLFEKEGPGCCLDKEFSS